jgi:hypothetical protein
MTLLRGVIWCSAYYGETNEKLFWEDFFKVWDNFHGMYKSAAQDMQTRADKVATDARRKAAAEEQRNKLNAKNVAAAAAAAVASPDKPKPGLVFTCDGMVHRFVCSCLPVLCVCICEARGTEAFAQNLQIAASQ